MRKKTILSLFLLICGMFVSASADTISSPKNIIVYYFHNTLRCPTCTKIENNTISSVRQNFAQELKNKRVTLKILNMELPENNHYQRDYKLQYQSVILSLLQDSKEITWKNLPQIWDLTEKPHEFEQYIIQEINEFLN